MLSAIGLVIPIFLLRFVTLANVKLRQLQEKPSSFSRLTTVLEDI